MSVDSIIDELQGMSIDERRAFFAQAVDELGPESFPWWTGKVDIAFNNILSLSEEQQWALISRIEEPSSATTPPLVWLRDAIAAYTEVTGYGGNSSADDDALPDEPMSPGLPLMELTPVDVPGSQESTPTEPTTSHDVFDRQLTFRLLVWGCVVVTVEVDGPRLYSLLEATAAIGRDDSSGRFISEVFSTPLEQTAEGYALDTWIELLKLPDNVQITNRLEALPYGVTAAFATYTANRPDYSTPPNLNILRTFLMNTLFQRFSPFILTTHNAAWHWRQYGEKLTVKQRDEFERVFLPGFIGGHSQGQAANEDDRLIRYAPQVDDLATLWTVGVKFRSQGDVGKARIRNIFNAYYNQDNEDADVFMSIVERFITYLYTDHKRKESRTPKNIAYLHAHLWLFRKYTSISQGKIKYKHSQRLGGFSVLNSDEIN